MSHLPRSIAFHSKLDFIRDLAEAPPPADLARALNASSKDKKNNWAEIESAIRAAEKTHTLLQHHQIHAVDYWSIHYPHSLRTIAQPPWVIYFIGQLPKSVPTLAIVGTRKPNEYGKQLLSNIIHNVTIRPLQIVSGLAYGIDSLAHFYACESQIPNFAIMGCGLNAIYPASHEPLAARIIESNGGIISEYPPNTQPLAYHFPLRNRIISGLADAVWIVQGTAKSGTVHTLHHALDQGKQVLATPGDIFCELAQLPNKLIYDGASIVLSADDIDLQLHRRQAIVTH